MSRGISKASSRVGEAVSSRKIVFITVVSIKGLSYTRTHEEAKSPPPPRFRRLASVFAALLLLAGSSPAWSVDNEKPQTYGDYKVRPSCEHLSSPMATTCSCYGFVDSYRGIYSCAGSGFPVTGYKDRETTAGGTAYYSLRTPNNECGKTPGYYDSDAYIRVTFPKCPAYVPPPTPSLSLSIAGGTTPIVFGKTPAQVTVRSLMSNSSGRISNFICTPDNNVSILSNNLSKGSWVNIGIFMPVL